MISFLEMVQKYPIGAKVELPGNGPDCGGQREIRGYEYYNGTGYLVFENRERMNVEQVMEAVHTRLH